MAVSIPLIRYSLEHDKTREASRQLNMMLAGARTRAIERGRPVGVWLQRSDQAPDACVEVYLAEAPAPYVGDLTGAAVFLSDNSSGSSKDPGAETVSFKMDSAQFANFVSSNDVIRFNRGGHYFKIISKNPNPSSISGIPSAVPIAGTCTIEKIFDESVLLPHSGAMISANSGVSFEILRHPRRLNSAPLQLVEGTCVDLRHSGVGAEGTQFAFTTGDADHVIVAFDGTGSLSYLFFDTSAQDVDGPVHLLVGRLDQLADSDVSVGPNPINFDAATNTPVTYDKNLVDQASIWVTIGSRNGTITTAENAWELRPLANPYFANSLRRAREYAQASDAMGGR
jgi:hypothetical protein